MSIPLINEVNKNDINTSIIAIKKDLERINTLLGLNNTEEIDTSIFATKEELEQAETDLAPVDEVTLNNMQSVTSNAVSKAMSYSTTEHKTGKKWIDGKDIYEKVIDLGNLPNATVKRVNTNITNLAKVVSLQGVANIANTDYFFPLPLPSKTSFNEVVNIYYYNSQIVIESGVDRSTWTGVVTLEYTKTTD